MSFIPANHMLYKITTALDESMCLDASQNQKHMNKLILWKYQGNPNQKFAIRQIDGNRYAFFCSLNNGTIEVPQNQKSKGTQIEINQPNKKLNELWELIPAKGNFHGHAFYIKSCYGMCLDVCEGKAKKEAPVIQWDYNGDKNQIWIISQA